MEKQQSPLHNILGELIEDVQDKYSYELNTDIGILVFDHPERSIGVKMENGNYKVIGEYIDGNSLEIHYSSSEEVLEKLNELLFKCHGSNKPWWKFW